MVQDLSQPLPYTADPTWLALQDVWLFIRITLTWPLSAGLPSIVFPLYPFRSGKLNELYPDRDNLWVLFLHTILVFTQGASLLLLIPSVFVGIPFSPTPVFFSVVIALIFGNKYFCILLNGRRRHYVSRIDPSWKKFEDERWIFVNGVSVGDHWMQSNLDRLAMTVRRPVYGIHNTTYGIIFDVIECIVQRTFGYATRDIRAAYASIVESVSNPQYKKIVLILHSQGVIEGGMALDWLYATMDQDQLAKIEVYTFGSAANHFNSPVRSVLGGGSSVGRTSPPTRVIEHVEHYANSGDYVCRFGILHFRPLPNANQAVNPQNQQIVENRYVGRLFIRRGTGHQLNGNYLDDFFTMDQDLTKVEDQNANMDAELDKTLLDDYGIVCKAEEVAALHMRVQCGDGIRAPPASVPGQPPRKIKDVSRLWLYRNGGSPPPTVRIQSSLPA